MKITKAIITAAGKSQRNLPLQTVIDKDGVEKSVLDIFIGEAAEAGISNIGIVIHPADADAYQSVIHN